MHNLHNVEKASFHPGEYVGYADGVWKIMRAADGWYARHRELKHAGIHARTLKEISARLDSIAKEAA